MSNTVTRTVELNIGLVASGHALIPYRVIPAQDVRNVLFSLLPDVTAYSDRIAQSATEETLVVRLSTGSLTNWVKIAEALCVAFDQAAIPFIPVSHAGEHSGHIVGPRAADWGKFDYRYFIRFNAPVESAARYTGHLHGSGVQAHSADEFYKAGVVIFCVESAPAKPARRLWKATRHSHDFASHPNYASLVVQVRALITGA